MIKKIYCFSFFVLLLCRVSAQSLSPQLPTLVPVTPTAAHLIKVGMGDANKATGAATANFPFYEVHIGNFKMPVGLSYFSQGNKTEEQCTRAGFGWSLTAGGVITRKVNDVADDLGQPLALPVNLAAHSGSLLTTFQLGQVNGNAASGFDTAPDEFMFNFNGNSGKFLIDADGSIAILSHQNLKITVNKNGTAGITNIQIVTPDGIIYYFGNDAYDRTLNQQTPNMKTAFYLYKVVLPTGQYVDLSYDKLNPVKSETGLTESVVFAGACEGAAGSYVLSHNWSSQYTESEVCILKKIETSEHTVVDLGYEAMPDLSGDERINSISVHNQNGIQVKHFLLSYQNVSGTNNFVNNYPTGPQTSTIGRNGRFYLTNITEKYFPALYTEDGEKEIDYPISYYGDIANENLTAIYSQDQFGFKNGKQNQCLLPAPDAWYANGSQSIPWANKGSDWTASVLGMLHTITYPTKGKEEFFYEPNTVVTTEPFPANPQQLFWQVAGGGQQPPTHSVTINHNQVIHLVMSYDSTTTNCSPPGGHMLMVTIYDNGVAGPPTYLWNYNYPNNPVDIPFNVIAGHTYSFTTQLFSAPSCNLASIYVFYDATLPGTHTYNKEAGGVRVRKIIQTDQFNAKLSKFFYYTSLADRVSSTGIAPLTIDFSSVKRGWYCQPGGQNTLCDECADNMYSSNGIYNIQKVENSHIYYTQIIEADDSLLQNGGTAYTFYNPTVLTAETMARGGTLPHEPDVNRPCFDGMIQKEYVFDNNLAPKAVTESNYELFDQTHSAVRTVLIRKMYNVVINTSGGADPDLLLEYNLNSFDVSENFFHPGWIRMHDTKVTQYDKAGHSFETNTNYQYGTPDNILPAAIISTDSKGNTITSQKKYPRDFPSDPVAASMVTANMIAPVMEESTLRSAAEIQKIKAAYSNNGTAGGGFQPLLISQKQTETSTLEPRISFSAYDDKGNLKEVSKALDGKISYIWDYNQSLVIAEVKNALKENIAYTSFEAGGKGNFTYSGTPVTDLTAPTGNKVYNPANGAVSFPSSLDLNKAYIVSYWSKSGSKSISGTTTMITGRLMDGWTYYEHHLDNMPANNTLSGSGLIDELRIYPADAMMTTYTYEPLIGVTSQCDINNRTAYYEYDGLGRLLIIRNQDKNIVKKICYNYAGQQENCFSFITNTPDWQPTGQTRCKICGIDANFFTGTKEEEQKDLNTQSPGYNTMRWVDVAGVTPECLPESDWHLTGNTRCEKLYNVNTGYLEAEEKDLNPCAPDYNRTKWIHSVYNSGTCPAGGGSMPIE